MVNRDEITNLGYGSIISYKTKRNSESISDYLFVKAVERENVKGYLFSGIFTYYLGEGCISIDDLLKIESLEIIHRGKK